MAIQKNGYGWGSISIRAEDYLKQLKQMPCTSQALTNAILYSFQLDSVPEDQCQILIKYDSESKETCGSVQLTGGRPRMNSSTLQKSEEQQDSSYGNQHRDSSFSPPSSATLSKPEDNKGASRIAN